MFLITKKNTFFILTLVLLACFIEDSEAKRRVLRGRRTITRTYSRGLGIPAWAIICIVAILQVLLGVGLYFGMRKWVLLIPSNLPYPTNTYAPARQEDV
ncbi:uncharacterized protein LOC129615826 [Condylostylus longicornis]|uniref:uncharacterized protein LOC129615826 n=1 Tax=Condylostylus longicornis TaxID=2530218 RepID=UPI00244DAB63|nr:uncharacterized protein LOC129615826 [Condylostylus longicornis]